MTAVGLLTFDAPLQARPGVADLAELAALSESHIHEAP